MFLDQVPPDTSSYMVAGYAIFFIITAIYLVSLFVRNRNLSRDMNTLESIEQESAKPVAAARATAEKSEGREAARARANKSAAGRKAARKPSPSKKTAAKKIPRKK